MTTQANMAYLYVRSSHRRFQIRQTLLHNSLQRFVHWIFGKVKFKKPYDTLWQFQYYWF